MTTIAKQIQELHAKALEERAAKLAELAELDEVLGLKPTAPVAATRAPRKPRAKAPTKGALEPQNPNAPKRRGRPLNETSLKILAVINQAGALGAAFDVLTKALVPAVIEDRPTLSKRLVALKRQGQLVILENETDGVPRYATSEA